MTFASNLTGCQEGYPFPRMLADAHLIFLFICALFFLLFKEIIFKEKKCSELMAADMEECK